jgi:hypothetical protein
MMRQLISTARSRRRTLARRLRALARPSAVLLLTLCFAFAEPLACIIHCELYVPWLAQHQYSYQHHQHSQTPEVASGTAGAGAPAAEAFVAQPTALPANSNCFQASGGGSSPAQAPPSPVHEVILAALLVLAGIAPGFGMPARAAPPPRTRGAAPPTPPPRQSFA